MPDSQIYSLCSYACFYQLWESQRDTHHNTYSSKQHHCQYLIMVQHSGQWVIHSVWGCQLANINGTWSQQRTDQESQQTSVPWQHTLFERSTENDRKLEKIVRLMECFKALKATIWFHITPPSPKTSEKESGRNGPSSAAKQKLLGLG